MIQFQVLGVFSIFNHAYQVQVYCLTGSLMATGCQDVYSEENCTCPICLEKSPKRLPCLNTFCDLCIQEFLSATEASGDFKPLNYLCPICRAGIFVIKPEIPLSQWVSLLPDIQIGSTMEKSEKKDNENDCDTCSRQNIRSEAKLWCQLRLQGFFL